MVTVKVHAKCKEDVNILKKRVTVSSLRGHRPDAIVPTGLDPAHQWYLYQQLDLSEQQKGHYLSITFSPQTQITKHTLNLVHYTQYFVLHHFPLIWCQCGCYGLFFWKLKYSEFTFFNSGLVMIDPSIYAKNIFLKFLEITPFLHARSCIYIYNRKTIY